jgi:hypothetical protein
MVCSQAGVVVRQIVERDPEDGATGVEADDGFEVVLEECRA